MSVLKDHLRHIIETTPFSSQTMSVNTNPMGSVTIDKNSGSHALLEKVEDLLRKVMVAETGGPTLAKIINKFLVDITPYMDQTQ